LPLDNCTAVGSSVWSLTDTGAAVGISATGGQAVRWTRDGQLVALPSLPGAELSWAYGINAGGVAVGFSEGSGNRTAVLWR